MNKNIKRRYLCIVVGTDIRSRPIIEMYVIENNDNVSIKACEEVFKERYDKDGDLAWVESYIEDLYVCYTQREVDVEVSKKIQEYKEEEKKKDEEEYKEYLRLKKKFE